MGYTTSTVHGIEVPDSAEANNIPEDIGKVVAALETGSFVKRLTGAQIAALTNAQKPAGLVVYNTTTNSLQVSDGSAFRDVPSLASAGAWVAWTPTVTQGVTVSWNSSTSRARYLRVGKTVTAYCNLNITGAGTAAQGMAITLPVNAVEAGSGGGTFYHSDSGVANYAGWVSISTSTASFAVSGSSRTNASHGINAGTLSNGDTLGLSITYEVA